MCGTDGDSVTVLAELDEETRKARQAYNREYFQRFRNCKAEGAVEDDVWLVG